MASNQNPLISDRFSSFLLHDVHDATGLCALPYFADHDRETFDLFVGAARRLAREQLLPTYKIMDEEAPELKNGEIKAHPLMHSLYPKLVDLGIVSAMRPWEVGGQQLPVCVSTLAMMHLMAANAAAAGYVFLTTGAAHLIESFGSDEVRDLFMANMYSGRWTGTMALTEPHAGSSLADITTTATPRADGRFSIRGSKIFISGGSHDLVENIVHLTLARIPGGPAGSKGISLFAVPTHRSENGELVPNDISASQAIHKIGWRGLPSMALDYGDNGDCVGWLVGEAHRGLSCMFQLMNEARILVGANGMATASVAYHQSVEYAKERPQGRGAQARDPASPQVAIIEHADVRRMLLAQKAIVEGGTSLILEVARFQDVSQHGDSPAARAEAQVLVDLLTPIAKTFPAEWGFESNALALQVHGGYGYSSEYLPEAWLRDQKLNSIHEGTTGIQGMDLLGRKVLKTGGQSLRQLRAVVASEVERSDPSARAQGESLLLALDQLGAATLQVAQRAGRDTEQLLRHSTDFLMAACGLVVAWQHLKLARIAKGRLAAGPTEASRLFYEALVAGADFWFAHEVPRALARLGAIASGEDSYARLTADHF